MQNFVERLSKIQPAQRIERLKERCLVPKRYVSFEQAHIITRSYRRNAGQSIAKRRALSFFDACIELEIAIDPEERIVGNRTKRSRDGVVFPEGGITWVEREIDLLSARNQDPFEVLPGDRERFFREILPYWRGHTLEDVIDERAGDEIRALKSVIKFNQTDHAQGHIAPDCAAWLSKGPAGLLREAEERLAACEDEEKREFYACAAIAMRAAIAFMRRYAELAREMRAAGGPESLEQVSEICFALSERPARSYWEALQSVWFLFVLLHMESNASSFSPGRLDQILLPYYAADIASGKMTLEEALEYTDALWIKFNQVVYLRNDSGARYFAGFPIGFNVAIGGQKVDGADAENELTYLFLRAQEHIHFPQPNLSARLYEGSSDLFLRRVTEVIGSGGGMPQVFNDESIIPAMLRQGIAHDDAMDYCIVGCVELTTQGNNLGWSDTSMFNMVKVLELTLNDGKSILDDGKQIGPRTGYLADHATFEDFEEAFRIQTDHFIDRMMPVTRAVDRTHAEIMPSAFLSCAVQDCLRKGIDVTAGGAKYNFSGIQLIQVANIADSLAALKKLVYDEKGVDPAALLAALRTNFKGAEVLRQRLINHAPKYGNDVEWVDALARKWHLYFARRLEEFENVRGGRTQTGLYTVSAHVPMGLNVAATPDGRLSRSPLADGGVSAVYGRDQLGPTALINSVGTLDMTYGSNGSLLNMKFLPEFFHTEGGKARFAALLRTLVRKRINHAQFNVVRREDLIAAQENPEQFGGLTIRVAGYTAFFVELDRDLQDEIIERTVFGGEE